MIISMLAFIGISMAKGKRKFENTAPSQQPPFMEEDGEDADGTLPCGMPRQPSPQSSPEGFMPMLQQPKKEATAVPPAPSRQSQPASPTRPTRELPLKEDIRKAVIYSEILKRKY